MIKYDENDILQIHGNIPQLLTELSCIIRRLNEVIKKDFLELADGRKIIENAVELAFMNEDELIKAAYEAEKDFDVVEKELKYFLDRLY